MQQGVNLSQPNMNTLLSNTNILQQQHLKQQPGQHKQQQQQLMKKQELKQQSPGSPWLDSDFVLEQIAIAYQRMMSAVFLSIIYTIIVCRVLGFLNLYYWSVTDRGWQEWWDVRFRFRVFWYTSITCIRAVLIILQLGQHYISLATILSIICGQSFYKPRAENLFCPKLDLGRLITTTS